MYENQISTVGSSYIKVSSGLKPVRGTVKGTITYQEQCIANVQWAGNQQHAAEILAIGTRSQWLFGTTHAVSPNRDVVTYQDLFSLNPMEGTAAGSFTPARTAIASDRMALTHSDVYIDIMNAASLACYLKVKIYMAKNDVSDGPLEDYAFGVASNLAYNATYSYPPAAGTASTTSGGLVTQFTARTQNQNEFNRIAVPPYHTMESQPNVKSNWRLLKTKKLTLAASDNHRLTIQMGLNQFGLKERLSDMSDLYPKGSIVVVLEGQGALALDSTSTTGTLQLSAGKVSLSMTRRFHLAPMKAVNSRIRAEYYANPGVSGANAISATRTFLQGAITAGAALVAT